VYDANTVLYTVPYYGELDYGDCYGGIARVRHRSYISFISVSSSDVVFIFLSISMYSLLSFDIVIKDRAEETPSFFSPLTAIYSLFPYCILP